MNPLLQPYDNNEQVGVAYQQCNCPNMPVYVLDQTLVLATATCVCVCVCVYNIVCMVYII